MNNLVKHKELSAQQLIEYEKITELMNVIDEELWWIPDTLKQLRVLYEDALTHKSSDALRVRFEILKYINELRWIKTEKQSKPINIAIFNNYDQWTNLKY